MERRVFVAIFLSLLVLYGYQAFFTKAVPAPGTSSPGQTGESTPAAAPTEKVELTPVAAPAAPEVAALVGDTVERDVRVETPYVDAVFTNRGGRLKSWRLKKYRDRSKNELDLVVGELAGTQPLPFSLRVADEQTTTMLNGALFSVRGAPAGGVQTTPTQLTFEYRNSAGLVAVKEFEIDPGSYRVLFRAVVSQGDRALAPAIVWGPGLGDTDAQTGYAAKPGGLYSVKGKVSRLAVSDITKQPVHTEDFEYVGIDDHYFTAIALKPGAARVTYEPVSIPPPAGSDASARDLMGYSIEPPRSGETIVFYVGPKDFETLAAIDRNLVKAIHFGMFSVIVVPLLRALNWIHGYVGNYGWSITILTILINLVLFPLNHKSVVSMRKMQEIQPEAKAIQERYSKLKATDPARQKMNQELMGLYRERGVNPASGCIPILLTLPVFLAFYAMLQTAIELRGAPFIGWIQDLSAPDSYYVLPILVGLSQIVTQWMTPQTGVDPAQQKMMMIMPIVLIFVFISTPAGALIYWLVGNIWRIGQMQLTNYLIGPPNIKTLRPAAERRVKRAGAGKTEGAARES